MNIQKKSTLNKSIIKRLHRLYDYQMSRVDLQCRLYERPKRHLCKKFIIRLKILQCDIGIKCLKLLIKLRSGKRIKLQNLIYKLYWNVKLLKLETTSIPCSINEGMPFLIADFHKATGKLKFKLFCQLLDKDLQKLFWHICTFFVSIWLSVAFLIYRVDSLRFYLCRKPFCLRDVKCFLSCGH